ncbi:UbiX family flavin prenyltransferase [Alicyclobacillus fastidiosus]|uniref:Flavin prenyltransferase UbiX n=1 Tax=Alicyclobacillus fastidiosus TaxID=392011 RepID=A0ABY6ZD71_9BACL|nr:UbiX family flavin prenyltransferase [Alicyclobacillus fastidiosus]WAH40070.1 UbiX family flavin prenyltransferase [Alicyclobacillus fastidiosus]GMA61384.1 putative UbiX-like flavin prenyltransferase [Alicyclobacillus fastidiosus]
MRIIVAITGATGSILGIRLLEALRECDVETHLVMSQWAEKTMRIETSYDPNDVKRLASHVYVPSNQASRISSGSFRIDGMVIAPCSMKTLASIRHGFADSLIPRAADVILKERKKLVILPRELPLSSIHLENMLGLSNIGALILPPMLTFYNKPSTLDDVINHVVARTLDQFGIENNLTSRWLSHNETEMKEVIEY